MATRITGKQRAARKRNIKVAQAAKKKGGSRGKMATAARMTKSQKGKSILGDMRKVTSKGGKGYKRSTEAAEYLGNRKRGYSKSKSRRLAIASAESQSRRLYKG